MFRRCFQGLALNIAHLPSGETGCENRKTGELVLRLGIFQNLCRSNRLHTTMLKTQSFALLLLLFTLNACVKPKIYRAEMATRKAAESREKVLVQELLDRKRETADLIKQVGDLNRLIGNQEADIKDLNAELSTRTQRMDASSSKLASEKAVVENELADTRAELAQRNTSLQRIQKAQKERANVLTALKNALIEGYTQQTGATVTTDGETVLLTLPDKGLFDNKGLEINAAGKTLLGPLAQVLAARPELDVDIVCHTDNVLPKDKTVTDTWDWSLRRATNLTRLLISEFNVNANQLTPVGRGEFYPVTSNETADGRQKNRRTVVVLRPVLPVLPVAE
jgi:chemotaxis protein MotB